LIAYLQKKQGENGPTTVQDINLPTILICKLEGKTPKISLGYQFFWTQHLGNM